jgi:hypothetical protein
MFRRSTPTVFATILVTLSAIACQRGGVVVDEGDGAAVIATTNTPAMAESDHVVANTMILADAHGVEHHLHKAKVARLWPGSERVGARVVTVDADDRLVLSTNADAGSARTVLLDHVVGSPVFLGDHQLVVARQTEPGETDLWIVSDDGAPPRAIAAAPGADDNPMRLKDGRLLFVSGRSGVASLWITETTASAEPTQLTNAGEVPGALSAAFRAPPTDMNDVVITDGGLRYKDDQGRPVVVALPAASLTANAVKGVR